MTSPAQYQWRAEQIAYCSNVHPGESWREVKHNLSSELNKVRQLRQLPAMASGLWLSNQAAEQLLALQQTSPQSHSGSQHRNNDELTESLATNNIQLTSLNGFPYGNFHQDVVKQNVYLPTWADTKRLDYSQNIATLLAQQLPIKTAHTISDSTGVQVPYGAISTLPLGYKQGWNKEQNQQAVTHLLMLVCYLQQLEKSSNKRICFGIEMEPDCVLESTTELIEFFQQDILPQAPQHGLTANTVLRYLGCCFDTCHQAVMGEDIGQSLAAINQANIMIVKVQVSNALSVTLTNEDEVTQLCQHLNDSKFLHQCKLYSASLGHVVLDDLCPDKLKNILQQHQNLNQISGNIDDQLQCQIHYHVPIHLSELTLPNGLQIKTTQAAIQTTLDVLATNPKVQPYLEIETYTWLQLLDKSQTAGQSLADNMLNEFIWLEQQLSQRNLLINE